MVTTGLIIAAGAGSRLADGTHVPKPLRKVCGMPLLERTILCAARAGLKRIIIVVGFEKEKIIDFIGSRSWPLEVETIENPDWQKSNGISVLAAREKIRENFILMMSDHVFGSPLLKELCQQNLENIDARLAIDYKINEIFDIDDATKVEIEDGRIKNIGKNLTSYNAIDTGLFLLSPILFEKLEEARIAKGDCSLSDGIQRISSCKRMGFYDIRDGFWQDVDTPESLAHAEKMLLQACRKSTDGIISRNFNRYISLFISSILVKTPLSANQVTFFTTLVGLASGYFASCGTYWSYLFGAFLFKWASILDGVDGEMSKLRLTDSKLGQWLDTLSDNLTYVVFITGTVFGVAKRTDLGAPAWLGWAAFGGMAMMMIVMFSLTIASKESGSLLVVQKDLLESKSQSWISSFIRKIYFVVKRDFFAAAFLVLAAFDKPHWILFLIALGANIAWLSILKSRFEKK